MTSNILNSRENLRPYIYPEFYSIYDVVLQETWSHHKVSLSTDLRDWNHSDDLTRSIIGGLLRTFTLVETSATEYWGGVVASKILAPEIQLLARAFSHHEGIHLVSYDKLDATLGIDSYRAFKQDPVACKKLSSIVNQLNTTKSLALSVAIFSGFVEGVSLFSSFAILLSFTKDNTFKGLAGILSYSIADEMLHSNVGIMIYHKLIEESPELKPDGAEIVEGCDLVVQNEIAFLKNVFQGRDLPCIKEEEAIDFVKYRANMKLMELHVPPQYELDGSYKNVKYFFDSNTRGKVMNDFFVTTDTGTTYTSTVSQDFLNLPTTNHYS